MFQRVAILPLLFGTAASLSIVAPDCEILDRKNCRLNGDCVWVDDSKGCVFDLTAKCTDIAKRRDCFSVDKCVWKPQDGCLQEQDIICSSLLTSDHCFAFRQQGCQWLQTEKGFHCIDEANIQCEDLGEFKQSCRKLNKCHWIKGQTGCVTDDIAVRCPNCAAVSCPQVNCAEDAEVATPEGECCPTCVPKPDCSNITCPSLLCFEGEKLTIEPGECCPACKKTCPCPEPDCSRMLCPPRLPCFPNEDAIVSPGGCCEKCVERVVSSSCLKVDCEKSLTCQVGEKVVTEPGECCPVCKKEACMMPTTRSGECSTNEDCNGLNGEVCYTGFDDSCDEDCGDIACPGKCIVEATTEQGFCGGIAGIACPEGFECVDSKGDGCSPNCGGADCGGICVEACPKPGDGACTREFNPVECGRCMYPNPCVARTAGFKDEECMEAVSRFI